MEHRLIDPKSLIVSADFKNHFNELVTDEMYHSDKSAIGSTQIREIIESPRLFYQNFILGKKKEESDAMRFGKILHKAYLEYDTFVASYLIMPVFGDLRTKANKDAKKEWMDSIPPGSLVVTQEEYDMTMAIIDSAMMHESISTIFKNSISEVAGYYRDPETGIKLKFKPDERSKNNKILADVKSCRNSSPKLYGSSAYTQRYDVQMFTYAEGIKRVTGVKPEIMANIACETSGTNECAIYYYEPDDLSQAEVDYRQALRTLKKCIDEDHWPQRQKQIERISTPYWFMAQSNFLNEL